MDSSTTSKNIDALTLTFKARQVKKFSFRLVSKPSVFKKEIFFKDFKFIRFHIGEVITRSGSTEEVINHLIIFYNGRNGGQFKIKLEK